MPKKLLATLLALTAPLFSYAANAPLAVNVFKNLEAGKPQTVLIYGTSLSAHGAWAVAVDHWFQKAYPHLVTFVNNSGSGKDSQWAIANLKAKVLAINPDLVFIEFAYNDSFDSRVPLAKAAENLDEMVTAIHKQAPSADVILQIMNLPWDAPNNHGSATHRPNLVQYDDNYRHYAAEKNLPLIDLYSTWQALLKSKPDQYHAWVPDGTHPNATGSIAITWPAVKAFLERSQAAAKAAH
ncbi:MAG TPA: SGNH/GDSL hydrolase family protein [Rariglobus sp.]|jgi:lysophospholipase L1-like esterase|nr:SGNH/GDSL hydrolase family protein [Rariglobus sp.]